MKRILLGLALLAILPALALAQAKPAAPASGGQKLSLEFVDGSDLTVVAADKSQLKFNVGIFEGDLIPAGSTIITGKDTSAELKLSPNGSIVKVGKNATFGVTSLAAQPADKNAFQVAAGKVKTIAAKGSNIAINTPTAVCGVRGTDFVVQVEGGKELLAVKNGTVAFSKLDAAGAAIGQALAVGAGMAADALAATFATFSFPPEQYDQEFSDVSFSKLSETEVPQAEAAPAPAPAAEATPPPAPPTQVEVKPTTAAGAAGTVAEGLAKMDKTEVQSGLMKWLQDILGFELGSVTINGTTYSKAIVQPTFNLGKLRFALYLPIIYKSDLFNPQDWYHPNGNDEWSFGTQTNSSGVMLWETNPVAAALDAAADVALKFRYFEFGQQLNDPFFIKLGSLNSLTIGHGLIMRNYANGTEFPAVRRIGFNTGIDFGFIGFEALVNDLADPYLYGGRLYIRPLGKGLAFGVSGVVDWNPAAELVRAGVSSSKYGDMKFVSGGLDLDLPIIQGGGLLTIRAFADGAATMPWTLSDFTLNSKTVSAGLQYQTILVNLNSFAFSNYGAAAGLMGNILFLDYRLEFRYYTGIFKPSFYDSTYDKTRASSVIRYAKYLADFDAANISTEPAVMGVYGEGGFSLIKDKLNMRFGYAWPWNPKLGFNVMDQLASSGDELHAALTVRKGLIPIIDVSGSIAYDRRGLAKTIYAATPAGGSKTFELIDENTTFSGELVIPVPKTPNLDVALVFTQVPVRDPQTGVIQYVDASLGIPKLAPSVTFETRFHF